jgi:hypothetical protein
MSKEREKKMKIPPQQWKEMSIKKILIHKNTPCEKF